MCGSVCMCVLLLSFRGPFLTSSKIYFKNPSKLWHIIETDLKLNISSRIPKTGLDTIHILHNLHLLSIHQCILTHKCNSVSHPHTSRNILYLYMIICGTTHVIYTAHVVWLMSSKSRLT